MSAMKLDEFVERALLDVANGVLKAQLQSPYWIAPGRVMGKLQTEPQFVDFDVSITTSSEAGGGLTVFSFGTANGSMTKESAHRISFRVPIHFNAPTEKHPNPPDVLTSNTKRR